MNPLSVIGQAIGLFAAVSIIISFQFKDNKKLFFLQACSTVLFTLHYLFLGLGGDNGAYAGMAQNFGGFIFRILLLVSEKYEKLKSPLALTTVCAYCAVTAAVTFDKSNIICILPMIANLICMGAMWTRKPNIIRAAQFFVVSPCWLIFNISAFSIAGIFTESFNIISIIVYYIRAFIKNKRDKTAKKGA